MNSEHIIRRLSGLTPGRRGFGGTSDAIEAASFRRELQDDRELNPGLISPPSAALRPAAHSLAERIRSLMSNGLRIKPQTREESSPSMARLEAPVMMITRRRREGLSRSRRSSNSDKPMTV